MEIDSIERETYLHYLAFSVAEVPDGDNRFKCSPPIRDGANKENLWGALLVRHPISFSIMTLLQPGDQQL
jgi:dihydroorotase-like cyclic amidohydrolase